MLTLSLMSGVISVLFWFPDVTAKIANLPVNGYFSEKCLPRLNTQCMHKMRVHLWIWSEAKPTCFTLVVGA